jgi:hypothetical protein
MRAHLPLLKNYFLTAALGNGNPRRFIELVKTLRKPYLLIHGFLITLALHFPIMLAIVRLSPWELYSRLYGEQFAGMVSAELGTPVDLTAPDLIDSFNTALYGSGYGASVLLPILFVSFALVVVLQLVYYLLASVCLGLHLFNSEQIRFRERVGVFVMSSTLPVLGAAIIGLWLPTLHIVVFYLAESAVGFALYKAGSVKV